jgi:hypothetical protein
MTSNEIIDALRDIKRTIETDRFTMERIDALIKKIQKHATE